MYPVIIDNFISAEDARDLTNLLDPLLKDTPRPHMRGALGYETSAVASQVGYGIPAVDGFEGTPQESLVKKLEDVIKLTKKTLEDNFLVEMDLVNCTYQELSEGASNPMHSDSTKLDGSPWRDDGIEEELEFSALIYLNDYGIDFSGGEIEFPNQKVTIKPTCGQLVFFKGDVEHIHEVKPVLGGLRKNLVFFFARKGNVSSIHYFEDLDIGEL